MTSPWWLLSAGAGIASAVLYGLAPASPVNAIFLSALVSVPLFMAGLGLGALAGATASAVAVAGVLVFQGPMAGAIFAGGFAVPVAILVRQAMLSRTDGDTTMWYPAGLLAATLTIIGLGLAVAVTAILLSPDVQALFDDRLRAFAESFVAASEGKVTVEELLERVEWTKRLLPGLMTSFLMLMLLAGGAMAQAALEKINRNLRPWPEFAGMELPNWMAVVAAISVATAILLPDPAGIYAVTISFAACIAYLLQGLAVVHAFNRKIKGGFILLVIFYLLVFGPMWPATLVVLLGAIEQFAGFRRRWKNGTEA